MFSVALVIFAHTAPEAKKSQLDGRLSVSLAGEQNRRGHGIYKYNDRKQMKRHQLPTIYRNIAVGLYTKEEN